MTPWFGKNMMGFLVEWRLVEEKVGKEGQVRQRGYGAADCQYGAIALDPSGYAGWLKRFNAIAPQGNAGRT